MLGFPESGSFGKPCLLLFWGWWFLRVLWVLEQIEDTNVYIIVMCFLIRPKMKQAEIDSLGFDREWLDGYSNEGGDRESQLGLIDYEIIKSLKEYGGLEAIDGFLDATWAAWWCATSLLKTVDRLFYMTKFGIETEDYDKFTEKIFERVIHDMKLALENASSEILYDHDPLNRADGFLESFADDLVDRLNSLITSDSEITSKGETEVKA